MAGGEGLVYCGDHKHFIGKIDEFTEAAKGLTEAAGDLKAIREKLSNMEETLRSHTSVHQKLFDLDRERAHAIHQLELDIQKLRSEYEKLELEIRFHARSQEKDELKKSQVEAETRTTLRNPLVVGLSIALVVAVVGLLLTTYRLVNSPPQPPIVKAPTVTGASQ